MADLITIGTGNPDLIWIARNDTYGGVQFQINLHNEAAEVIRWAKEYRAQLDREAKAREKYESVAAAYEQYQTVLKLVLDV